MLRQLRLKKAVNLLSAAIPVQDIRGRLFWAGMHKSQCALSADSLYGIHETVLLYLLSSNLGKELDSVQKEKSLFGEKWRKVTEIVTKTQLYAVAPFGFEPSQKGLQAFMMEASKAMTEQNNEVVQDLQKVNKDIWSVAVKRGFGVKDFKWLEAPVVRSLAMGVSSHLTNPGILRKAADISKSDLSQEKKMDAIHEQVIAASYRNAMTSLGMATDDVSLAVASASINTMLASDHYVAQSMQMGFSGLMSHVPSLAGEIK